MLGMAPPGCDGVDRPPDIADVQCRESMVEWGPYGLGRARTVREFEELSGVNFTTRTLAARSKQFWPERAAFSGKYEFYEGSSRPGGKPRARHRWGSLDSE